MPKKWKKYKLFDFMDINPRMKFDSGKQYSFVEMKDLDPTSRKVLPSNYKTLKGGAKFQNGDTLFARITPCLENGKICQVQGLKDNIGIGSTEFLVFRGKENVSDSDFVYYLSRDPFVKQFAEQNMIGTSGRQRVAKEAFINLELNLPPLPEQKAIAEILSAIDDKIENNLAITKTLEDMAMALYKHWFVDFGPFQDDEFFDSELGPIPKGWGTGVLDNVLLFKKENIKASEITKKLPYVPIDCISSKSLYLKEYKSGIEAKSSLIKFSCNDFIFGAMRPYFHKVCIAPFSGTTRSTAFVFNVHEEWMYSFGLCLLNQSDTIKFATSNSQGSTIPYAKWKGIMSNYEVIIPPDAIIRNFEKEVGIYFQRIVSTFSENQSLTKLRDALLPKLISGEVRLKEFQNQIETVL